MGNIRSFKRAVKKNRGRLFGKKKYIIKTNSEGQKVRVRAK